MAFLSAGYRGYGSDDPDPLGLGLQQRLQAFREQQAGQKAAMGTPVSGAELVGFGNPQAEFNAPWARWMHAMRESGGGVNPRLTDAVQGLKATAINTANQGNQAAGSARETVHGFVRQPTVANPFAKQERTRYLQQSDANNPALMGLRNAGYSFGY